MKSNRLYVLCAVCAETTSNMRRVRGASILAIVHTDRNPRSTLVGALAHCPHLPSVLGCGASAASRNCLQRHMQHPLRSWICNFVFTNRLPQLQ